MPHFYLEPKLTRPRVSSLPAPGMAASLQSLPLNPLSAGVPGGSDNLKELSKCSNWIKLSLFMVPLLFFLPSGATTRPECKPRPVASVRLSLVCGSLSRGALYRAGLAGFSTPVAARPNPERLSPQPASQTTSVPLLSMCSGDISASALPGKAVRSRVCARLPAFLVASETLPS